MKIRGTFNTQLSTFNAPGSAGWSAIRCWLLEVGCSVFPARHRNRGSAVLIVLAVLGLMTIFVAANTRIVYHLKDEVRLTEKRQMKHWAGVATNVPPANLTPNTPAVQP